MAIGIRSALALLLAALLLTVSVASAEAGLVPGPGGVIHACLLTKGKAQLRGTIRVVASPRKCRRGRGERAIAWNGGGATGPTGETGATGAKGEPGANGLPGAPGSSVATEQLEQRVEELETTLNATIVAQATEILALTGQVSALESTLAAVCTELTTLATRSNEIVSAVGGIGLVNLLNLGGLGLKIPTLPSPLPAGGCP
jgi:hypothetical protein